MSEFDVKGIRTKIGLTQKELAEKIGITQRAVQKWEAGGVVPESKKKMLLSLLPTEDELNSYHINGSHSSQAVGTGATAVNGEGVKECLEIIRKQQESISKLVDTVNSLTKIIGKQ
ncbi:MAG: helix-turn-helix domain-containing protein [Bacteroidales bacterium]|nr:helix-turn-helix domain-containing protein [Bacteroidales bacterium]